MTLYVKKGKLRLWFVCPLGLAGVILRQAIKSAKSNIAEKGAEEGQKVVLNVPDKKTVKKIISKIREAKKRFGKLTLLCAQSAKGEKVVIKL